MSSAIYSVIKEIIALIRNAEDTEAGVRLFHALGGKIVPPSLLDRVQRCEMGKKLLEERPELLKVLMDRQALRALPSGTLGRTYIDWADKEGLYPEGLIELIGDIQPRSTEDVLGYLEDRVQAMHDLMHVVTGYGRDKAGEIALTGFSSRQEKNTALRILSISGQWFFLLVGRRDLFKLRQEALRRADRAPLLPVQNWEQLISIPLDEVRKQVNLYPAPQYRPFETPDVELAVQF